MHPFGQSTICPRCSNQVYMAEQVLGPGRKIYHKSCFKCAACKKRLDSNFVEHEEDPYCRQCHSKTFGTRDLRSGNVSPDPISSRWTTLPSPVSSPTPTKRFSLPVNRPIAEVPVKAPVDEPKSVLEDSLVASPSSPSPSASAARIAGSIYSHSTGNSFNQRTQFNGVSQNLTGSYMNGRSLPPKANTGFGGTPVCPRCSTAVYFAEQVNAIGKKWHKACLKCNSCNKRLDSFSLQEHGDDPYCKPCHIRNFGTRDLRSANLSPSSTMTSS